MMFKLRIPRDAIQVWADRYSYNDTDPQAVGATAQVAGYLTLDQFLKIAKWKSQRRQALCKQNSEEYVRAVTGSALSATEPRFKIEALRILDGVDWPTASVVLHFCDSERWPIIDYRAFWSLSEPSPAGSYSFDLWQAYTAYTRQLADDLGVSMRTLDRALWAYSKEKQR
jgi:hypothetical protein